jgi:hypothetical protein
MGITCTALCGLPASLQICQVSDDSKVIASDAGKDKHFGFQLAASDNFAIIAAGQDLGRPDHVTPDSAYIFQRGVGSPDERGDVVKLNGSQSTFGQEFGYDVAIDGDSDGDVDLADFGIFQLAFTGAL